ncbi:cytosine permease [uncultured Streptomyces sp.]|uniref:purine-cytosine permease family protein n=1 Tax=uncultured Streptomyces sp. TaxID=174707 RepID=UPI00262A8271|nr:cytosine permease [uncultured Streptomyces sp.]
MTTNEAVTQAPPSGGRGGSDADEVFQVEQHGIDPIPDEERHGGPRDLFWLWFGSNLTFTYVINGALAVSFGLSFWQAVLAVVAGGLTFAAISAAGFSGVRTGTATLVISRAAFGPRGNWPAGLLNWIVSIGYTIVNTVVGALALQACCASLGWDGAGAKVFALAVTLVLTFAVALWGHATVQWAERWMAYVLALGFAVLLVLLLPGTDTSAGGDADAAAWSFAFVVMLAGPISYVPMPADYTRYLPRTTKLGPLTLNGALGGFVSSVALGVAGAAAATQADLTDAVAGTQDLLPSWFQPLFLALVLGGSVTNSIITLYSSSLNLQVLGIPWGRSKAIVISAAVTAVGSLAALFLVDFTESLLSFLSLLVIVFAPWAGVFLTDMVMRRCQYDAPALHVSGSGSYWYRAGFHPAGVVALLAGMVFAALTCDSTLWTGPLVAPLGGLDLSAAGALVAAAVYRLLGRRDVRPAV